MIYRNRKGVASTKRGDRASRSTHYGNPIEEGATMQSNNKTHKVTKTNVTPMKSQAKKPATKNPYPNYAQNNYGYTPKKTYAPVSDEVTVYGAKKFRTPFTKDEFTGRQGSKIPAYIFDIDGTLQSHGSGIDNKALAWAKKLFDKDPDAVFLVITARDHGSFGYETSFNWLMRHFPYPFIGPFARPKDDPRYASEFKRELAQGFEDMGLYQILGAADDNDWVIKMWKQWAIDHFENPEDFDLLECGYGSYAGWRNDLPTKGGRTYPAYGGYGSTLGKKESDDVWVAGAKDPKTGNWVGGHYAPKATAGTKAGTSGVWAKDPADGLFKRESEFIHEYAPGDDIASDPRWQMYFNARKVTGAYTGVDLVDEVEDVIDAEVVDEGYSLARIDLEQIVRHDYPGYKDHEIEDMSMEDLREHAGIVNRDWAAEDRRAYGSTYLDDDMPLFSDDQLGVDSVDYSDEERRFKVDYRLDLEDEVMEAYPWKTMSEVSAADLVDLEDMLEPDALAKAAIERDDYWDEDAGPQTAPLDVREILAQDEDNWDYAVGEFAKASQQLVQPYLKAGGAPYPLQGQLVGGTAKEGVVDLW